MTMNFDRPSAEIYQFPLRGRFAVAGHRDQSEHATGVASSPVATTAFGGNWYHEEAIREAERARKS
jgi:Protein of unknown function (DUF2735)